MTQIVVSKRDGIVRAPDGTKHRVARGKTLADARHPVVEAYPNDWVPMVVELSVDDDGSAATLPGMDATEREELIDELRSDVAEAEEVAEHRGAELVRLAEALEGFGYTLPAEDDRRPGWLVDFVLEALPVKAPPAELPVDEPAPHSAVAERAERPEADVIPIAPPRGVRKPRPAKP